VLFWRKSNGRLGYSRMCDTLDFSLNNTTVFQKRTVFYMPEQAAEPPQFTGLNDFIFITWRYT